MTARGTRRAPSEGPASPPSDEAYAAQPGSGEAVGSVYLPPWRVDVTRRRGVERLLPVAAIARLVVAALRAAGAPAPASVGVILADDAELAALNRAAMGHEGPTDVLSFPLLPPSAFPTHPGRTADSTPHGGASVAASDRASRSGDRSRAAPVFALPPGERPHLGDIVVSVERAAEQAREGRGGQTGGRRWSPRDELRLLVVHGVLHVCGWDHAHPAERDAMRALENAILAAGDGRAASATRRAAWPGEAGDPTASAVPPVHAR